EKIPSQKILVHVALFTVLLVQGQGTGQRHN
ncbi:TPA: phage tail protein, partial [Escherichia coli]|nr:phage tail protein [Escherichia coli]